MSKAVKTGISWSFILISITALVLLDVAWKPMKEDAGTAYAVAEARADVSGRSTVAIVRSDNARLPERADPDAALTEGQVEAIVREACRLADIEEVVRPEHRWIAIKPNIVELKKRGSGVITDWRVVKAIVKIVHEIAPEARISIAEGGAWIPPERTDIMGGFHREEPQDGFEVAGYRALLDDEELSGVRLDIVDLNFDEVAETPVPGGAYVRETYFIPKTVLECDVLIDVPVLKVIAAVGMTNAMKNFVGIAPGMIYGWSKSEGYPPGSGNPGIPHSAPVLDEAIVELTALSGVDFVVVDAIVGMEKDKTDEHRDGIPVRLNTILAGGDVVAVDAVSARLIGLNPDDLEYITLGSRKGLGISDLDRIEIRGEELPKMVRRFEKPPVEWGGWGERGHYGQSNRLWLLKGPFPTKDGTQDFIDPTDPRAQTGQDGWSEPLYFHDDKIDLDTYYGDPSDCVAYAYAEFDAPKLQEAELWVGSDEGLAVWINGDPVYAFQGARRHHLPNDREAITIRKGTNTLLMKAQQSRGRYDFSVNICEPEEDPRYDGTRVFGLKFSVPTGDRPTTPEVTDIATADREDYDFGESASFSSIEGPDPFEAGEAAPERKILEGFPKLSEGLDYMIALQAVLAYRGEQMDASYLTGISGEAFKFYYDRRDPSDVATLSPFDPLPNVCDALGYTYAYSYNEEPDEAWSRLKGWIDMGYPVMACSGGWRSRWGVVVGYEEENHKAYLRQAPDPYRRMGRRGGPPPRSPSGEYETMGAFLKEWMGSWPGRADRFGNPQFVVGEKVGASARKDAVLQSLRNAVKLAADGDVTMVEEDRARVIPGGFHAYRRWWEYLQRDVRYDDLERRQQWRLLRFNSRSVDTLIGVRRAAAEYLKGISKHFDGEDRGRVEDAAEHYRIAADRLAEVQELLPQSRSRMSELPEEELAKFADHLKAAERLFDVYREEHAAVRLLGEVVDMPVPPLETWIPTDKAIARGEKLLYWECLNLDGVDDLIIQDEEITVEHLEWDPPEGMHHSFSRKLPKAEGYHLIVKWLEGRGEITVIEQPNAENSYAARIRVDDGPYGDADAYRFEVYLLAEGRSTP